MDDLALILARCQFALTTSFHYLFPPMSIGLGLILVIFEGIYVRKKDPEMKEVCRFWTKIFSLFFAMGVATGFVQLFSFGNNWARFSNFVGDVYGTLLAPEAIFAFFLEASFIGFMLFGWEKVSRGVHYLSTCCVVFGAHFSAIWIVMANSWMHTPDGYKIVGEGMQRRAIIVDLWKVYFTPSTLDRIAHVLIGCWVLGGFMVLSVASYYILKKRHVQFSKICIRVSIYFLAIMLVVQLISADSTAKGVYKYQPVKFAAFEGVYKTEEYTPIALFGYVDTEKGEVIGPKIPGMLSFLANENFKEPVKGLDEVAPDLEDRPNVQMVFQTYHIMVMSWVLMVMIIGWALWSYKRRKIENSKWLLRVCVVAIFLPYLGNLTGWMTTELGRQPWVVQGLLRTKHGVTNASVSSYQIMGSLTMFSIMFTLLFALFIFLLNKKIQHGPDAVGGKHEDEYDMYSKLESKV
ncbi:MAG: cytochrome ubiquinol oxidase subunit I [Chlamydiia bacterium]